MYPALNVLMWSLWVMCQLSGCCVTITPVASLPHSVVSLSLVWRKRPKHLFVQGYKMWSRNPFYQLSDLTRLKQTILRSQAIKQKMPCLFCFSDLSECNFLDCNIIVSDHLTNWSSAGSISQITAPLEGLSREINSFNFENVTKWSSLCVGGSENGLL